MKFLNPRLSFFGGKTSFRTTAITRETTCMSRVVKQETLYQYSVIHRPWVWRTITMGWVDFC